MKKKERWLRLAWEVIVLGEFTSRGCIPTDSWLLMFVAHVYLAVKSSDGLLQRLPPRYHGSIPSLMMKLQRITAYVLSQSTERADEWIIICIYKWGLQQRLTVTGGIHFQWKLWEISGKTRNSADNRMWVRKSPKSWTLCKYAATQCGDYWLTTRELDGRVRKSAIAQYMPHSQTKWRGTDGQTSN